MTVFLFCYTGAERIRFHPAGVADRFVLGEMLQPLGLLLTGRAQQSAVNHLKCPDPPPAPDDPADPCSTGRRSHVSHLLFLVFNEAIPDRQWGRGGCLLWLLGTECFHLQAIKGLPSMETLTAWGVGRVAPGLWVEKEA